MVTLLYKRQNLTEEVTADVFGISQGTAAAPVIKVAETRTLCGRRL
jgi:hypothetical protein